MTIPTISTRQLVRSAATIVVAFFIVSAMFGLSSAGAASPPPAPAPATGGTSPTPSLPTGPGDPGATPPTACDKVAGPLAGACNQVAGAVPGGQTANQTGGQVITGAGNAAGQVAGVVTAPVNAVGGAISVATDPLGYFAQQIDKAVKGLTNDLTTALDKTTEVPLTQPSALSLYADVWAVGLVLTVALWLWALALRVARGQSLGKVFGETFGLLIVSYAVTMLAVPAVLLVVQAVDAMCAGISGGLGANMQTIAGQVVPALGKASTDGVNGPFLAIVLGIVFLIGELAVWVVLLVRAAMIVFAVVLAPLSFAGLVNKSLWPTLRPWVGRLAALIGSKFVIYVGLVLGSGLVAAGLTGTPAAGTTGSSAQDIGTVLEGIALVWITIFAAAGIGKFVPILGDHMGEALDARRESRIAGPIEAALAAKGLASSVHSMASRFDKSRGVPIPTSDASRAQVSQATGRPPVGGTGNGAGTGRTATAAKIGAAVPKKAAASATGNGNGNGSNGGAGAAPTPAPAANGTDPRSTSPGNQPLRPPSAPTNGHPVPPAPAPANGNGNGPGPVNGSGSTNGNGAPRR